VGVFAALIALKVAHIGPSKSSRGKTCRILSEDVCQGSPVAQAPPGDAGPKAVEPPCGIAGTNWEAMGFRSDSALLVEQMVSLP